MSNSSPPTAAEKVTLVWQGRPAVGRILAAYGVIALVAIVFLVTLEWYLGNSSAAGSVIFPSSVSLSGITIPYPVEMATSIIILFLFVLKAIQYGFLRARNRYELYGDGLYINSGIVNLQNTYVAPMAFSDARLIRTWPLRVANRGLLIVDTNDSRHFHLQFIKNPLEVQSLIRRTLGHPRVRIDADRLA